MAETVHPTLGILGVTGNLIFSRLPQTIVNKSLCSEIKRRRTCSCLHPQANLLRGTRVFEKAEVRGSNPVTEDHVTP